jgi:adenylate cyclase
VEAEQATLFEHDRDAVEYRFRQKDGGYRWVRDEQHLLRDAKGEPFEIVGSWIDITGRRKAKAAEDAARARLSVLLESAPSVIYSFEASDDYAPTFVSENIKRLLGYCPEKYLEHADFWRDNVPEDLASVEAEQGKLFEKGRHTAEYRFACRFDLLMHGAPAVVYSFAATGSFAPTFVSENIKRVLGYEPDDYLQQPDFWRSHVHPEDLPAVEAEQKSSSRRGGTLPNIVFARPTASIAG